MLLDVKLPLNKQQDMQQGVSDSHCKSDVKHKNNKKSMADPVKLALNREESITVTVNLTLNIQITRG